MHWYHIIIGFFYYLDFNNCFLRPVLILLRHHKCASDIGLMKSKLKMMKKFWHIIVVL